ncbi:MAG: MFS transporter [Chloroflexi bacterium]|nr:MFS transporter [Chloroflexota bacterium]
MGHRHLCWFFYTDVFGLTPTAVGTLFLVARLLDAVNDPIVGYILDHLKPTRWGRFPAVAAAGRRAGRAELCGALPGTRTFLHRQAALRLRHLSGVWHYV